MAHVTFTRTVSYTFDDGDTLTFDIPTHGTWEHHAEALLAAHTTLGNSNEVAALIVILSELDKRPVLPSCK